MSECVLPLKLPILLSSPAGEAQEPQGAPEPVCAPTAERSCLSSSSLPFGAFNPGKAAPEISFKTPNGFGFVPAACQGAGNPLGYWELILSWN